MKPSPWTLGSARVLSRRPLSNAEAKWIGMETLHWRDEEGKNRAWESTFRRTRPESGIDGVEILPLISAPNKPLSTVLVTQYRPSVDKICVELPAGLVDEGETYEQAAVRELKEETGYDSAEIVESSGEIMLTPGMSSSNMALVIVRVEVSATDADPEQVLDSGEHIVKLLVPVRDLFNTLQEYKQREGYAIEAHLYHLAYGLSLQSKLG